jgi:hypothetical protein
MRIIKDMKIKVKKVYFTTCAAIVLFIIIAGCVSTQPHATIHPISVVASVQTVPWCTPGSPCNPAGPPSWVTVNVNASSTDVPVTQLSLTVLLAWGDKPVICDNFGISEGNPLMPGQTASATCGRRRNGPQVDLLKVNGTTAVLIEGTLQNGQSFSYWTNETAS